MTKKTPPTTVWGSPGTLRPGRDKDMAILDERELDDEGEPVGRPPPLPSKSHFVRPKKHPGKDNKAEK